MSKVDELRSRIREMVVEYYREAFPAPEFVAGPSPVPVSGRVFDECEIQSLVDSALDFWLTTGRFADQFERDLARFVGVREAVLVNSGSSANLLAISALTSPKLGDRRLLPGDEVITLAAGFPTTVNPILQNNLVPVFIDVQIPTYNVDVSYLEAALSDRTRALIFAHTLGNPFDLETVTAFAKKHNLWLIEDCCDALGSTYRAQKVGTFGDLATFSFYPAHHITMGEGGCVLTNQPPLRTLVESFRDWGRDCWCAPGKENTCGKRFGWQLGQLPYGYDHKYIYSHIGYNLKATDMQAAIGVAQLQKLPSFIETRKRNFSYLRAGFRELSKKEDNFLLPESLPHADPSWFGFPLLLRESAPFSLKTLSEFLHARKIGTRQIFGGNLVRQPAYADRTFRVVGDLAHSDRVMNRAFWIGVYPGLTPAMLDYVLESINEIASKGVLSDAARK
ncbi:MAG TPA: lipopolysaccharide biosynthesis protein RfbH [Terriglobales bacterium]|nr:lipopolysaccharide biosynthesis protein RfbH [Terriglobales bacterium]